MALDKHLHLIFFLFWNTLRMKDALESVDFSVRFAQNKYTFIYTYVQACNFFLENFNLILYALNGGFLLSYQDINQFCFWCR